MMPGSKKRKIDFTDVVFYVAIATKHARLMVLLMAMSLTAGLVYYIYARPLYRATALVHYQEFKQQIDRDDVEKKRFAPFMVLDELTASHIVGRVMVRLGYVETPGVTEKPMIKKISASFDSEKNILVDLFTFKAEWARPFCELLVAEFKADREQKTEQTRALWERKIKAELDRLEIEIQKQHYLDYQLSTNFNPQQLTIEVDQLRSVPRELAEVSQKLALVERIQSKLATTRDLTVMEKLTLYSSVDAGLRPGQLVPATPGQGARELNNNDNGAGIRSDDGNFISRGSPPANRSNGSRIVPLGQRQINESLWENLVRQRLQLEKQVADASRIYLPRHPKMITLQRAMDAVDRQLQDELLTAAARFDLNVNYLLSRKNQLNSLLPTFSEKYKRLERYENEKRLLKGSQPDWEGAYKRANMRLEEMRLALDNERVNLQYVTNKRVRDKIPVSPSRVKLVLLSFLLGLALAVGVPFLLEFMDQTVTNMDKLEEETGMRGLGIVPDFEETLAESYPLLGSETMTDPDMLENFRVIRTNLISSAATSKYPQVILVTSTGPKEGKTVVASNLAISFAQMGEKTLVIDCNLRRGLMHHLFSSRSSPGLSNALVEKLEVADAIRPMATENLSLLPCGEHLEGDIEMLGSTRMQQIIEELRGKFQRIVIDAPPVLGLSETSVLQANVDGSIMVIWSAFTSTRQIRIAMEMLKDNHANFYGFVLNRLDLAATMNRFHYYYYSNHYYNRYQSMTRTS